MKASKRSKSLHNLTQLFNRRPLLPGDVLQLLADGVNASKEGSTPFGHIVLEDVLAIPCVDLAKLEGQRQTLIAMKPDRIKEHFGQDTADTIAGLIHMLDFWADMRDGEYRLYDLKRMTGEKILQRLVERGAIEEQDRLDMIDEMHDIDLEMAAQVGVKL